MNINYLRENDLIVLECISGSKAYGLDTPNSDTDIKGVFFLPKPIFYGLNYVPQINDETNDTVFYEFGRFMELLSRNNPNILELLSTPEDCVIAKHRFFDELKSEQILSKLCKDTFGKFALSQIKKAKGLNKKIVNPIATERKSVLDFCFVNYNQGSIPLKKYLELKNQNQENCGLVNIPQMEHVYGLYYGENLGFKGILRKEASNDICLSSIPKDLPQQALLFFNKNGYSAYCKEYRNYWDWVGKRNETRYENTQSHGKNYDAKNMMHTFRLLDMAIEIAREKKVNVKRSNRTFLLDIKDGKFEYDELLILANAKQEEMEIAFNNTNLPNRPDLAAINKWMFEKRDQWYRERNKKN